jgi:hypothetical protein
VACSLLGGGGDLSATSLSGRGHDEDVAHITVVPPPAHSGPE